MEYISGGDLFDLLNSKGRFTQNEVQFYIAEILIALEYLHENLNLMYRDLKLENILINEDGHIKLCDFGLTCTIQNSKIICGTPEYIAPEILKNKGYSKEVDIWSLGIVLYELLTGNVPFRSQNISHVFQLVLNNQIQYPDYISTTARDLLEKLLEKDSVNRIKLPDIKKHEFFSGILWEDVALKKLIPPQIPSSTSSQEHFKRYNTKIEGQLLDTPVSPGGILSLENFTYRRETMGFEFKRGNSKLKEHQEQETTIEYVSKKK